MSPFPHRKQLAGMVKEARVSRVLYLEINNFWVFINLNALNCKLDEVVR